MVERLNPYPLGSTGTASELTHLEGYRAFFEDVNSGSSDGVKPELSAMTIEAMWVKNGHTAALTPNQIVKWDTGANENVGKVVDLAGAAASAAGVVDPYLPSAGAAVDEHFWIIVRGPATVIHAGNDTIARGDSLVTAASGRVDLFDGTATTAAEMNSRFGRAIDTPADNSAATTFRALVDFRF